MLNVPLAEQCGDVDRPHCHGAQFQSFFVKRRTARDALPGGVHCHSFTVVPAQCRPHCHSGQVGQLSVCVWGRGGRGRIFGS